MGVRVGQMRVLELNDLSRYMMAPKLRFSRGLKAKAPGAVVTACVPLVEIFTGPSISAEHKKQRW